MDLFVEVGQFCRDFDVYAAAYNSSETSPLLRASIIRQQQEWSDKMQEIQKKVQARHDQTMAELQKLDIEWNASTSHQPILEKLENIGRLFSYFSRWRQQLDERQIQLKTLSLNSL